MSSNGIERLVQVLNAQGRQSFAPRAAPFPARVSALVKEASTGIVTGVRATLVEGGAEVEVPIPRGTGVREGATVTLLGDATDPTQPLRWGQIDYSDDPSAGNADDADLAFPEWGSPDHLSLLVGPDRATLTVYWLAIDGKGVSGYQPSLRRYTNGVPGDWTEPVGIVPHLGGTQLAQLGANFAPGELVDVQIRAFYPWAHGNTGAFSVPSELKTFILAVDDISPGDAIGVTWNVIAPGIVELRAYSNNLNSHFKYWRYELATSASGAVPDTRDSGDSTYTWPVAAGTYYAAVTPYSGTNTPGGRYPGSGFVGRIVVVESAATPDLTPPPTWAAPLLNLVRAHERPTLTITLPTTPPYPEPTDYDYTEARVSVNGGPVQPVTIPKGQPYGYLDVDFGTSVVTLVGRDKNRNFSLPSPAASASLGSPGGPSVAPILTATAFALAIQLQWTTVVGAFGYEIQRASETSPGSGTAGAFAFLIAVEGVGYLDTRRAPTDIAPRFFYRVRAQGSPIQIDGPFSVIKDAQMGKEDGQNILVNSITAAQLAADVGIFNKIIANQEVLLNGSLLTSSTHSSTHVELRGPVATNPNQFRFYENMTSYVAVRGVLDGTGLRFYSNNVDNEAAANYWLGFNRSGGAFDDVSMRSSDAKIILGKNAMQLLVDNTDLVFGGLSVTKSNFTPGVDGKATAFAVNAYVLFGQMGRNVAPNGGYLAISQSGQLSWGSGAATPDISMTRMGGGAYGTGLDMGGTTFKAGDFYSVRPNNGSQGVIFLGDQSGGARYLYYENTSNTYNMPGANLVVNGVTVSSSAEVKRSIRAANLDTAKAHGLRARRFRLRDDPQQIERLGFVAEEVRAVLPEAVHELDPTPLREGDPQGSPLGIDLIAICAAQQELIGDLLARVTKLEGKAVL